MIGGSYDASLLWKLAIGGALGAIAGSGVAPRIPNRQLRFALSLWLLVIGFQFVYQAAHLGLLVTARKYTDQQRTSGAPHLARFSRDVGYRESRP